MRTANLTAPTALHPTTSIATGSNNYTRVTTKEGTAVYPVPNTDFMQYGTERVSMVTTYGMKIDFPVPLNPQQRELMLNSMRQQGHEIELYNSTDPPPVCN